jgi:hypothetical protein
VNACPVKVRSFLKPDFLKCDMARFDLQLPIITRFLSGRQGKLDGWILDFVGF